MKTEAMKLTVWAAGSGTILYLLLAPERGLLNQGPWAAAGAGLLAAAIWKKLMRGRPDTADAPTK